MATKRVLAIHDMCSFGRCSLTAAIPVISAMGFQVCPFPTAIFSNNLTYGDYTFSDFTPHMTEFMDKWQKLGYSYDAIYSGFLADAGQIAIVLDAMGPRQIIITSVPTGNETITVVSYDAQTTSFDECTVDRIPFSTCGTGDLFTSVLTGSLLQGQSLHDSVKKATQFLNYAIGYTYQSGSDPREGVQVEPCLKKLF